MSTARQLAKGWQLHQVGDLEGAEHVYRQALAAAPNDATGWCYLGMACHDQGRFDEAANAYQTALRIQPQFPIVLNNLANTFRCLERWDEAAAAYRRALQQKPDYLNAQRNLGESLAMIGEWDQAIACLRAVLQRQDSAATRRRIGELLLLTGAIDEGWPLYRDSREDSRDRLRSSPQPIWEGESLAGKTIFVRPGERWSDTLQLLVVAEQLRDRFGANVVAACPRPLLTLLSRTPGVAQWVSDDAVTVPDFDVHTWADELPFRMKLSLLSPPPPAAAPTRLSHLVEFARRALASASGLRVGCLWSGGDPNATANISRLPAGEWSRLLDLPGVQLCCLQTGAAEAELPLTVREKLGDFASLVSAASTIDEQAALISQLDLLISVDGAPVQIAGRLGVPVWVLLERTPHWRWQLHRDDCPWLPTARLFRQSTVGGWSELLQRVREALTEYVASSPAGIARKAGHIQTCDASPAMPAAATRLRRRAADMLPAGSRVLHIGDDPRVASALPFGSQHERLSVAEFLAGRDTGKSIGSRPTVLLVDGLTHNDEPLRGLLSRLRQTQLPLVVACVAAEADVDGPQAERPPGASYWRERFREAGFTIALEATVERAGLVCRLTPDAPAPVARSRVLALSFLNVGNFGDRLGFHLLNQVLPAGAELTHTHFGGAPDYHPVAVEGDFDLLVLGIGNSLSGNVITQELLEFVQRAPRIVGFFGAQYRETIDSVLFRALLGQLDVWFARYEEDVLLYGSQCSRTVHLGDWFIDAFPMTRGQRDETLRVGGEIWETLPLDRTIQRIQSYRRVFSTRVHPLLCALTSASQVGYREQRLATDGPASGKFRGLLLDIFGSTFPEERLFDVDRDAVAAYKASVRRKLPSVREEIGKLLST